MIDFDKELKSATRNYIRRTASVEELSFLFGNTACIDTILSDKFDPVLRGQFVEFLRQEFLHFDGYTQYDKYGKVVSNFAYAGKDRADIRASKQYGDDLDNVEVRVESGKVSAKKLGVRGSDIEGTLIEAEILRSQYLGKPNARLILGIITTDAGVTKDLDSWFNSKKLQYNIHKLEVFTEKDIAKWYYSLSVIYTRQAWVYRTAVNHISNVTLYYHQERLQVRWVPTMIAGSLKLLVVWGCRTGKTIGSISLMKAYAEASKKQLRVCVVTAIPSLFEDWETSIAKVFGNTAVVHRHRSGSRVQKTDKHLFILSSAQMLNPDDKDEGIDKETNNAVIYGAKNKFDVLIYDEGHQGLTAENTFKQVVKKINHDHRLGLTATPFRNGLLNTSVFEHRDVFDYWQQMSMKETGHPDYQNVPERFLLSVKPSEKLVRMYKQFDLLDLGANLDTIYNDPSHTDAAISILEEAVFKQTKLLGNADKHKIKDIIIRANNIAGAETLLHAFRNYVNPLTSKGLDGHLFGMATGSKSDLPGVNVGRDGVSADQFKTSVDAFFKQTVKGVLRKVLIVVDQGIVGHTFETVNTTIDLTTGVSLIQKYQFWDRGGTKFVYPDGYEKGTYYHFDLDPFRLYQMGQEMLDAKRADRKNPTTELQFFELLNLFEVSGGVHFTIVNQTAFKEKVNQMIATNKLSQLLPKAGELICTDDVFNEYDVPKLKNGFGSTGFGDEDDPDLDKKSSKKRIGSSKVNSRGPQANLDKSTVNAVERLVNVLPMLAFLEEIKLRNNLTTNT
jgi:superfamily II DNA or RNA helicase